MKQFIFEFKVMFLLSFLLGNSIFGKALTVPVDYPTITLALKNAEPGDSIFVKAGEYIENIQLVDGVVLQGEDKYTTIINGKRKGYTVRGADNAVIKGFTVTQGFAGGILCENNAPIILDNIISKNRGSGIMAVMALPQIKNNIIYGNEWTGVYLEAAKSLDTKIDHNIIIENGYAGVSSNDGSSVLITNNIIYKNKEFGVCFDKESMQSRFEYNDLFGNVLEVSQGFNISQNNIHQDPMFVDGSSKLDFKRHGIVSTTFELNDLSPCRKMGEDATDIGVVSVVVNKPVKEEVDLKDQYKDTDGDGIFDADDKCPSEMETFNGFEDEDGCPDKKEKNRK